MNRIISFLIALIVFSPVSAQENRNISGVGNWSGKLELPGTKLEIIFKIKTDSTGKVISKMDVPVQNAKDLPVSNTQITSDSLKLAVAMIRGSFGGKFENDSTVSGKWNQNGVSLPLTLKKTNTPTVLNRPQTPKPPFPYKSEDVIFTNPASGFNLAGSLTIPTGEGKFPAVVLISGSGAQDRNESLFGHQPFWVIADYLSRNGIAVLRYDDRGVGKSGGTSKNCTSADFATDAQAAFSFLKTRNEIDHEKMGYIGHSEGGLIAPMIAAGSKEVAFIVMLAGPGINGEEILYQQKALLEKAMGATEIQISAGQEISKKMFTTLKTVTDSAKTVLALRENISNGKYDELGQTEKNLIDGEIAKVNNKWFRYFLTYDPVPALKKVKCPVLALNGEKDLQVPSKTNLPVIEQALKNGKCKNYKTMEIPELNHLFQHCKTGSINEYEVIEETFSPEVLEIIKHWIVNLD